MKRLFVCSLLLSVLSIWSVAGTCPSAEICPGIALTVNGQSAAPSITYTSSLPNNVHSSFDTAIVNNQTGEEVEILGAADTIGSTSIDQGITIRNLTSSLQTVTATWDLPFAGGPYGLGYVNIGETINAPTGFSVPYTVVASVGSDSTGNLNTPFFTVSGTCTDPTGSSSYVSCGPSQVSGPMIATSASGYQVVSETAAVTQFENFSIGGLTAVSNATAPEPATFALVAGILGLAGLRKIGQAKGHC